MDVAMITCFIELMVLWIRSASITVDNIAEIMFSFLVELSMKLFQQSARRWQHASLSREP